MPRREVQDFTAPACAQWVRTAPSAHDRPGHIGAQWAHIMWLATPIGTSTGATGSTGTETKENGTPRRTVEAIAKRPTPTERGTHGRASAVTRDGRAIPMENGTPNSPV